jgi:hypothetical protein
VVTATSRSTIKQHTNFNQQYISEVFERHQAELGLLLAALGSQQRHHPEHFFFAIPRSRRS